MRRRQLQGLVELDLRVVVDGDSRRLPDAQGSYVVAIPAGAASVDLVMKTDDVRQSLSLLNGAPGPDNIPVLARQNRFVEIGESFRLTETTTIELDYGDGVPRTSAVRDVDVESARLGYFVAGRTPGSTQKAFLVFDATFTRPYGDPARHPVKAADMRFIADGTTYEAIDIEDGEVEVKNAGGAFEVPANVTGGTLVIGGRPRDAEATNGTPYVVTLQAYEIELLLLLNRSPTFGNSARPPCRSCHVGVVCPVGWYGRRAGRTSWSRS